MRTTLTSLRRRQMFSSNNNSSSLFGVSSASSSSSSSSMIISNVGVVRREFSSLPGNDELIATNVPTTPPSEHPDIYTKVEHDQFVRRHIGPRTDQIPEMLKVVEDGSSLSALDSLDALIEAAIPASVRAPSTSYDIGPGVSESEALAMIEQLASTNKLNRSFIGMGYYDTDLPTVILRNVLENPQWYTAYTPYQAEISQGRLEALMNFQVAVGDLTGLRVVGASLLDEATAAAEAMNVAMAVHKSKAKRKFFLVSDKLHPQTIAVMRTRAEPRNIELYVCSLEEEFPSGQIDFDALSSKICAGGDDGSFCGAIIQYPNTIGTVAHPAFVEKLSESVHHHGAILVAATDLLALTMIKPPGEMGVDIAIGNSQRFGVPMGYGGPHAGFFATHEKYTRQMPGRIIGASVDSKGKQAYRMALQTREQHIRREKASTNICTAQVLLANIAGFYALYHGPKGLRVIGEYVHNLARVFATSLSKEGFAISKGTATDTTFFDTVDVLLPSPTVADSIITRALEADINLRRRGPTNITVAFDEPTTLDDVHTLIEVFAGKAIDKDSIKHIYAQISAEQDDLKPAELAKAQLPGAASSSTSVRPDASISQTFPSLSTTPVARQSLFLQAPIFSAYTSEHEMLRYINRLASKDITLTRSMIPLGSCTMKLNATSEMLPITWKEFSNIHPFAPLSQTPGYRQLFRETEKMLANLTGFHSVSLQPNAGSQGEFAGLMVIRKYLQSKGGAERNICLIPQSAHGTNPASATMAGMTVKVVNCDNLGNIDMDDLAAKCAKHADHLAALMVTYPSTHGVFEESIRDVCDLVHKHGGQVYMDGANMNAQCGFTSPGFLGADVCHLNLHKTFCIPHGGGGPGVGPIGVAKHLTPHLPTHPLVPVGGKDPIDPISAAPWGSSGIVPISYMYLKMMGTEGIQKATQMAILNANYMMKRLKPHFRVLYTGTNDLCAHEFIIDIRPFKKTAGVVAEDISKRLMDFGFHSPTMSFPVANTLMIEPTESESKEELDRFVDALIQIRKEIDMIADGTYDKNNNPLKNAPHTSEILLSPEWDDNAYSRFEAAFPLPWVKANKYWPPTSRIDNIYGDKNLNISCPCEPLDSYRD